MCDEVARMLGVEEVDPSTPGFFTTRMPAIKNILARMSLEEKVELDRERDKMSNEGYPEDSKRK